MNQTIEISPDLKFIQQIKKSSKAPLKQCMQCGNCTAVCSLSKKDNNFPRKEMNWTAWGLKYKLLGNPNIWLCHQCGDCTTHCPRDVKPADILSSLRHFNYLWYAKPKFLGKWLSSSYYLPLVVALPLLIINMILYFAGSFDLPESPIIDYSKFFPHIWLKSSFTFLTFLSFFGAYLGIKKFWNDMKLNMPGEKKKGLFKSFIQVVQETGLHLKFNACISNKSRYFAHLMVFWGFVLLLFVTLIAILNVIFFEYPMRFLHPAKILSNFSSILLFICSRSLSVKRVPPFPSW